MKPQIMKFIFLNDKYLIFFEEKCFNPNQISNTSFSHHYVVWWEEGNIFFLNS